MTKPGLRIAVVISAALGLAACEPVVLYEEPPLFSQIPGALVGGKPVEARAEQGAQASVVQRVTKDDEGNITMLSLSVQDLIANILDTMDMDRPDLFANQLLSEITRAEFIERGYDPEVAFDYVRKRDRNIRKLFSRMPGGEFTPGLYLRPQGRNVYRLTIPRSRDYPIRGIDVVFESPSWRLRWFID